MDHAEFSQLHNPYAVIPISLNTGRGRGERCSQWSNQEIQDFLMIRAELDPTFMAAKRNKLLWELVSARMNEIGYNRNPQQCKSKWKNLITRYKGCEVVEEEEKRQEMFPFYNEIEIIFNARMQRMLWRLEEEGHGGAATPAASSSRRRPAVVQISSNDEDENDNRRERGGGSRGRKKKRATENPGGEMSGRKRGNMKATESPGGGGETSGNSSSVVNGIKEIMKEFMKQNMEIEMQWMKVYEEREERRREREMEWRQRMEALERERMMMIRWWREREEQRTMREEARAERRDALITALLNKL